MSTGENKTALRRIADMTRLISIVLLGLHIYYCCYGAFRNWQLTMAFTDRLLFNIASTGLFRHFESSKFIALGLLLISLLGTHGKKEESLQMKSLIITVTLGLGLYFGSVLLFHLILTPDFLTLSYFLLTGSGLYLCILQIYNRLRISFGRAKYMSDCDTGRIDRTPQLFFSSEPQQYLRNRSFDTCMPGK